MLVAIVLCILSLATSATSLILIVAIIVKVNRNWNYVVAWMYDGGDVPGCIRLMWVFVGLLILEIVAHIALILMLHPKKIVRRYLVILVFFEVFLLIGLAVLSFLIMISNLISINDYIKYKHVGYALYAIVGFGALNIPEHVGYALYAIVGIGALVRLAEIVRYSKLCMRLGRARRQEGSVRYCNESADAYNVL
uniref:G_PROTEIN_RECEP_F1_2 domain-containing protein n=1 Tax=Steinernema glaseri TaxID=37863 RepID=A0A1I7YGI9_9BILA